MIDRGVCVCVDRQRLGLDAHYVTLQAPSAALRSVTGVKDSVT